MPYGVARRPQLYSDPWGLFLKKFIQGCYSELATTQLGKKGTKERKKETLVELDEIAVIIPENKKFDPKSPPIYHLFVIIIIM